MTRAMTKEQVNAWQEGWEMLAEHEREVLRQMSTDEKLAKAFALMASAKSLGWLDVPCDRGEEEVWELWRRLKEHHGRQQQPS